MTAMMLLFFGIGNVWGDCTVTETSTAGTIESLTLTATKISSTQTKFVLTNASSCLQSGDMLNADINNWGGGAGPIAADFKNGWSEGEVAGSIEKTITWTTYPTGDIHILLVPYRTGSGTNYAQAWFTIDVSCESGGCDTKHFYFVNTFTDRSKFETPYAYLWKDGSDPVNKNAEWPGVAISKATDVTSILADYVYEVTYDGNYDKVIFSDNGSNQNAEKDISNCQFYMNGDWYGSIEEVEAMMVYFVNTSNWSDENVKVHIWKNGGSTMNSWNDTKETMYYTGAKTNDNHKVYFYPCYPDYYDKIQFHNNGNNSDQPSNQVIEATHFFNYADKCYYTSTKFLNFSNSGWTLNPFEWSDMTSSVLTTKITISNAASNYEFNIKSEGESYYYNHGTMAANNCTDWKFNESSSTNCWIDPDVPGDYLFKYDFAENKLSVVYPPYMTSASLNNKTANTAVLNVTSTRGTKYKVVDEGNSYENTFTPTDGKITVTNLTAGTAYTFRVYAMSSDATPIQSSNYIDVTTSTYPNVNAGPTGYYDCQVQAIHTSGDEYSPAGMILADWSYTAEGAAYEDGSGKKAYKVNTNTTFYAGLYFGSVWTGTPTTLCNASSCTKLHVEFWSAEDQTFYFNVIAYYGFKNNDGTAQSVSTSAGTWRAMDFTLTDFGTAISDHKDVISAFKIDYGSGNTRKELIIANAYFYTPDVCESMKCHGSGSAGSGLTINTAEVFDTGESYWTKAYMYNSKLHIDAKFTSASSVYAAAAYVQFVKLDGGILQFGPMTNNADSFSIEVTPSDVTDAYRYDGIARYSVKFELSVSPKIRQTDYHYYDFTNSECAPDYFDIYHYDDATGSQRTSYAGGTILQPIRYFRHFEHTDWCAITFPFSVSKVVVDEGGTEYDLYPRFNNGSSDVEGYYWLKTFDNWNSTPVAISEFQSAWKQLTVSTASSDDAELAGLVKPAKDVPYVIAFPDGSYYGTYWVIFYGDAEQTIASSEDSGCGTSFSGDGETVKLQRNNMMQPTSSKTNIYMLEEGHNYYSRQTQAIPAFESYVIGTATVQGKYRVLRMDNVSTPETPTDIDALPTTECRGAIYSLSGMRIATFADRDAMEQLLSGLSAGVYVVRAGAVINKVVVQ